jgi:PAS domain S-box-containing protein
MRGGVTQPGAWKLEWFVLGAALLVLGVVVGTSEYREREEERRRQQERLGGQTAAIAELLSHQLAAANDTLGGVLEDAPAWTRQGVLETVGLDHLTNLDRAMPTIRTVLVTDPSGVAVASSRPELVGRDFSSRDYFRIPQERPEVDTLYVSPPYRSSLGAWTFSLTRVRLGPSGLFEGVVTASVDLEELKVLFGAIRYAPDMRTSLVAGDGTLLLTVPAVEGLDGRNLSVPGSLFTRFMDSGLESSVLSGRVVATGEDRMMAQRVLRPAALHTDAALVVAASRDLDALYADWRAGALRSALLLVLLAAGSTTTLALEQRRRRLAVARLEETEARSREEKLASERFAQSTLDAMTDQVCVLDGQGVVVSVNAAWRAFAEANDGLSAAVLPGCGYLEVCERATGPNAEEAAPFAEGLRQVLSGRMRHFSIEYPCHSPAEPRWFVARVTRFDDGPLVRVVVAHQNVTELKRTQEAHRLTTARFEAALSNSAVVVFNQDLDLRYTWIHNPALGYQANQVLGLRDTDIFERAEDAAVTEALKREVLTTGERRHREVVIHDRGVARTYDLTVEPQRGATGAVESVMCVALDITARKQIEQRLAGAVAANQRLVEAAPAGILVYQAGSGQCVLANAAAQAMVGATELQFLAQRFREVESWKASGLLAAAEAALTTGAAQQLAVQLDTSFGRVLRLHCVLTTFEREDGRHLLLLFNDVTARALAEDSLRTVSAQLSSVLNGTGDIIAMMDTEYRYTVFNAAFSAEFKRIFGVDVQPGDSMLVALARVPGDLANARACWDRAFAGEDFTIMQEYGDPGLGRTWYELHFTPVRDPDGQVSSAVHVVRDITERKLAEEAFRASQARSAWAERLAATATLSRGMAHEVNNPLASVLGNLSFMQEQVEAVGHAVAGHAAVDTAAALAEVSRAAKDAMISALRIRDIVADLRTFTLAGDLPARPGSRGLMAAILDARRIAAQDLAMCRSVTVEVPASATLAMSHPDLVQLLAHLLINAGQATGAGPNDVRVEASEPEPGQLELRIVDTGVGVDASARSRAFEPFFTTKEIGKGRGLGLSACLGIVEAAGGEIRLESTPAQGTSVTVRLPTGPVDSTAGDGHGGQARAGGT